MLPLKNLSALPKSSGKLLPFRCRSIGGSVLLTTDFGDFAFVSEEEVQALYQGQLSSELEGKLAERGFIRDEASEARLVQRVAGRRRFMR